MPKCEYCGKETTFPYRCSYCGKVFCVEHRLAENHQCQYMPKGRIPLSPPRYDEPTIDSLGRCPDCNTYALNEIYLDADTMTFECKACGRKWTQLKREPHKIVKTRDNPHEEIKKPKKKHWFF